MNQLSPEQALRIASVHHHFITVIFIIGYVIHAGLQVDSIARAKGITRRYVIAQNGFRLAARFFVSLMAFYYVWKNPATLPTVLGYIGVTLSSSVTAILTLPMSPSVAGLMGFAVDSLLAYVPWLKNALPPIDAVIQPPDVKIEQQNTPTQSQTKVTVTSPPKQ